MDYLAFFHFVWTIRIEHERVSGTEDTLPNTTTGLMIWSTQHRYVEHRTKVTPDPLVYPGQLTF